MPRLSAVSCIEVDTGETHIFARLSGSGPPVLLLHGFPQTSLMWRAVAERLSDRFTIVCADLRGYGHSGCPPSAPEQGTYSKRVMARDLVALMRRLGHEPFALVGHDRGGRVAYRLALDHPASVQRLAVLDVVPTDAAWARADARFALAFWPWSLLAQPAPLPERMLAGAAEAVVEHALSAWGTPREVFSIADTSEYAAMLRDPDRAHAICEEYRAASTVDREHDAADRAAGRRIGCPVLVMYSAAGPLGSWYDDAGGPAALWRPLAADVRAQPIDAGHFFPEERPDETADLLAGFLAGTRSG